ncbi:MAG: AraC family transcriptional regulator [Planctomycetes bacterium]|nr:AraC family transcriptional regulator [Planctomycetota bacterium]
MLLPRRLHREQIVRDPGASLVARRFRGRGFAFTWHHHGECELTWIVRGSGLRHVGASVESFAPGDLCLLGADVPHSWSTGGRVQATESLVVQFDGALLGEALARLPEGRPLAALLARAASGLVWRGAGAAALARAMAALAAAATAPERLAGLVQALALAAAAPARALNPLPAAVAAAGAHPAVGRVLERLHRDPAARLPLARLAAGVGLAPATLSRLFHRDTGRTLVAYRAHLRLLAACRLLAEGDLPVLDIALRCGFDATTHFNRSFRAAFACTPRQYRARARG